MFTISSGVPETTIRTSRSHERIIAVICLSEVRVAWVRARLWRSSIWRMAVFVRKSADSANSSLCSVRTLSSGAFARSMSSAAYSSTSRASATDKPARTSITRARNSVRSLLLANEIACVMEPSHASIAIRARSGVTPTFWERIPAASRAGIWRKGTTWQRETMVGSTPSRVRPRRMNTTPGTGSSRVFRKAFAA